MKNQPSAAKQAVVIGGSHGAVKRRPGGQHLAHRKAPREAAAAVEEHPLLRLNTDRGVIVHASSAERLQHVGLQHDAPSGSKPGLPMAAR
jgi:hypothetical protein